MSATDSSRLLRWSRWGLVLASLVVALVLVLPAWFGYAGTLEASQIVARGQGQAMEEAIVARLRALEGPPTDSDLAAILETFASSGLRYLELGGHKQQSVGVPIIDARQSLGTGPKGPRFITAKGRVRMEAMIPMPPKSRPAGAPPPGPRPMGPLLSIEYEPGPATQLVTRARTSLVINSVAALALLVASCFAFFWMRRQERGEMARARERHLATLGEMSAVLAHEIRNPLTSLKGHAQLLAESLQASPEKQEKANRVVKEAIRLETLTTDLLDFVRTGELRPHRCNPAEILKRASADVDAGGITLDLRAVPAECMLDSDRMQQALSNLLRNATQASDGEVEASVEQQGGSLVFEVRDRGPGIAPAELEHVFEAFRTTKVRGTGLGLAVVRRVVELHGGVVTASNRADGGAVFQIKIPVVS